MSPKVQIANVKLADRMYHNRWGVYFMKMMLLSAWLFEHVDYAVMMKTTVQMGLLGVEAVLFYGMLKRCGILGLMPFCNLPDVKE